ncbi:asparagine synthetase B family protein, partial [Thermodesulfobacteriota bacterium]
IPAPWTIFRNIKKLEPGNYLLTDEKGISIKTYWDIPGDSSLSNTPANDNLKLEEHKQNLFNLMDDAVKRRLISDVPIGAFLSGGIDSSVIVALMARNSNRSVQTFSIGYNDLPSFDETSYARDVADLYSTDHNEFKLGYKDILDVFPTILEGLDEPFADSSAVPSYIVSRETRNHVTVALSGDGGDELFAGYRMYQGEYWARYYSKIPLFIRNGLIAPLINTLPDARDKPGLEKIRRIKKFIKGMSNSFAERFYGWREIFPELTRKELLKSPQTKNLYLNLIRNKVIEESDRFNGDMINLMLYLDVKGLLPNDMLTKVDRMSMANSLEVRTPFLDHSVVEYAFSLKSDLKIKGKTGKFILMETFKDLLPPSLHNRPKWGFEMPIGAWLRKDLKFLIHEYLSEKSINSHDIFNYHTVKDLINRHLSGKQDTSWHLWNLIVFQHWFKTYI